MRRYLDSASEIARARGSFSERPAQIRMADEVAATLAHGGTLVCEAGTGTGKSLAYLVPAALAGRTVVISTATRALQAQLREVDIPLVELALGRPVRAEVLKGRANYLCKLLAPTVESRLFDERHGEALERLRPWLSTTRTGDRAELEHEPPADLWSELAVGPERCRGARCPHVRSCFAERARERAADAELVLVNHALYFADLGLRIASDGRAAILPEHDAVVFDEAHALEDVAAEWLGARIGLADCLRLAREAERAADADRATRPARALIDVERHAATLFAGVPHQRGRVRLQAAELAALEPSALAGLGGALNGLAAALEGAGEESDLVGRQARRLVVALESCVDADLGERVVWSERSPYDVRLHSAPIDVGPLLREALWDGMGAAVLTSATLTSSDDFGFVRRRLGLEGARTLQLGSPFDFREQALLYLPESAPDPRDAGWERQAANLLVELVQVCQGRALCLFTSHRALHEVHALAAPRLRAFPLLRQGDAPRERLLERFRADVDSVLFATASFWQGVDVPGEACSCVVIDRLPFAAPSDPMTAARAQSIERDGGSSFSEYALPAASLMLKQGFGRLLRSGSDRGVVCVLDRRLRTARYGPELVAALPPAPVVERIEQVAAFLANRGYDSGR